MGVALGMALVAAKPYKHFAWNLAQVLASASNLTTTWGGSRLVFDPTQNNLGTILFGTWPKFRAEV